MNIKLTNYDPHGTFDGDIFEFDLNGTTIAIERWRNEVASGREVYNKTQGSTVLDLDTEFEQGATDAIDNIIERVDELWSQAFLDHLYEIYERERTNVVRAVNRRST